MPAKVVDASAVAAFLFNEPEHEEVLDRLEGCTLIAPALIWFEVANVCVKKAKSKPEEADAIMDAFNERSAFEVELSEVHADAVVRFALRAKLSAYDANYLWLARERGLELVTLDKRLAKAAE